jgi:hypothetical protein
MPPSGNFGTVSVTDGQLSASGQTGELVGGELLAVSIAITQDGNLAKGPAEIVGKTGWATGQLPAEGFVSGKEALAVGCETFVTVSEGTVPSFTTFTWVETVAVD